MTKTRVCYSGPAMRKNVIHLITNKVDLLIDRVWWCLDFGNRCFSMNVRLESVKLMLSRVSRNVWLDYRERWSVLLLTQALTCCYLGTAIDGCSLWQQFASSYGQSLLPAVTRACCYLARLQLALELKIQIKSTGKVAPERRTHSIQRHPFHSHTTVYFKNFTRVNETRDYALPVSTVYRIGRLLTSFTRRHCYLSVI